MKLIRFLLCFLVNTTLFPKVAPAEWIEVDPLARKFDVAIDTRDELEPILHIYPSSESWTGFQPGTLEEFNSEILAVCRGSHGIKMQFVFRNIYRLEDVKSEPNSKTLRYVQLYLTRPSDPNRNTTAASPNVDTFQVTYSADIELFRDLRGTSLDQNFGFFSEIQLSISEFTDLIQRPFNLLVERDKPSSDGTPKFQIWLLTNVPILTDGKNKDSARKFIGDCTSLALQ